MDKDNLYQSLSNSLPPKLARDIVDEFVELRQDVTTGTLGRAAPGKFVETFVQILQFLETGKFEKKPDVDEHLRKLESRSAPMDDGLRICASRIARAMYAVRSTRSIVHKGGVDANKYDLSFLLSGAQWLLSELVRVLTGSTANDAGKLIEQIQAPVGGLVEDFGDRRIVLTDGRTADQILILLFSYYPARVAADRIRASLDRLNSGTVRNVIITLWKKKLIDGDNDSGYKLTLLGHKQASELARSHLT